MNKIKTVKSYGIACCRKNPYLEENKYEVLFIKKRLTYGFIEFVNGRYNNATLLSLLDTMNSNEKTIILTLNFKLIWYHCNLTMINNKKYIKAKYKFDSLHKLDNGKKLQHYIKNSKDDNLIWEIPKGRCKKNESSINAAIREFEEETCIDKMKYKILYDRKPIIYSFIDNNINYIYYYYIGVMLDSAYEPKINYSGSSMLYEVSNIQYININDVNVYNNDKSFYNALKKIIKILKNLKY